MAASDVLAVFPSALGWMAAQGCGATLKQLVFGHETPESALRQLDGARALSVRVGSWNPRLVKRLQAYAEGAKDDFLDVELDLGRQTPFQRAVVESCRRIGFGRVMTYGELAQSAGYPRAARAVGNVMRTNRIPLIVPCHRVVGSGGAAGGYSAGEGVRMKLRLLELETVPKKSKKSNAPGLRPGRPHRAARPNA
ncbi:MAG TPA: methylated-DNA--[protein]-cysteine S-methyltransferase [Pirellulales bacterium]|jgi:methylated-DNA-[protein]-cysteine S-methyltransferase|nr:methylated-DNA--[protein]-cysteine S-methyltransferase [Pirellulales bacterium]